MSNTRSLVSDVKLELKTDFKPPRTFLNTLAINSVISFIFFLFSYLIGNYNDSLLPVAATTVLLWTIADASITNQLLFDKTRAQRELRTRGTLKRLFLSKNITVGILSIPITIVYGLILVSITSKWSDIIYGVILAFVLIWGWLGVSNMLSVILPFEQERFKELYSDKKTLIKYTFLYVLPWILLPVYVIIVCIPFLLLGWTKSEATTQHHFLTFSILFIGSIILWIVGLFVADNYAKKPNAKIKKLLLPR